ncbi:MAG: phenylacetate--CoA ligase family protein [Magnetococcales bacterium]|nr:phenylacetate--CoA ligase family protein [Magnetococcales bacterium]
MPNIDHNHPPHPELTNVLPGKRRTRPVSPQPSSINQFRSMLPSMSWPAISSPQATGLMSMLLQLEQTQWLKPEQILTEQFKQLNRLVHFSRRYSPYYWKRLAHLKKENPATLFTSLEEWRQVPILTREDLQNAGKNLHCEIQPKGHGPGNPSISSGSTGRPVTVFRNNISSLVWQAITIRDHFWHKRQVGGKQAIIRLIKNDRGAPPPDGIVNPNWGPPTTLIFNTGQAMVMDIASSTIKQQADWLIRHNPDYLLSYPTNVHALAEHFRQTNSKLPNLKEVRTLSESLSSEARLACQEVWGVPVSDMYSAEEVGYIALQCPENTHYHIQSENLLVEILNDADQPCKPGEIGRVVVTTLHNFVSPLIRYEIGDYAEAGPETCSCGRGLPIINQVMGRSRNLLILPSGDRAWPIFGLSRYGKIAAIRQVQMIQHTRENIEVRLVVSEPLTPDQEAQLVGLFHETLGYSFKLDLRYLDIIPRQKGGKFEEFISKIHPATV